MCLTPLLYGSPLVYLDIGRSCKRNFYWKKLNIIKLVIHIARLTACKSVHRITYNFSSEYPELCAKSRFVLVPGPQDPGFPLVFPRPALPEHVTKDIRSKVPNVFFGSNPCRIQYCTQVSLTSDFQSKNHIAAQQFSRSNDLPTFILNFKTLI
jgi:hypothetical protein